MLRTFGQEAPYSKDDGWVTHSSVLQAETEADVADTMAAVVRDPSPPGNPAEYLHLLHGALSDATQQQQQQHQPTTPNSTDAVDVSLERDAHVAFCLKGLGTLRYGFRALDSSRPWIVYWCLNALDLMGHELGEELSGAVVSFLSHCANEAGGFGGGPSQMSHLAPTYAAVCALAIVGSPAAYDAIDTAALRSWILSLKTDSGAFTMHHDGEADTRACYCALHVAALTGILDDELCAGVADYVLSCQGFDGGFGAVPGAEPHGGYTYCGLAALTLLGRTHEARLDSLLHWAVSRQMFVEGGFQGRTNKLVDGCYSFWQGALTPMIDWALTHEPATPYTPEIPIPDALADAPADDPAPDPVPAAYARGGEFLFGQEALQDYILLAAQQDGGGLRDKPGKYADYYHTCYNLAGLAVSQHNPSASLTVVGPPTNVLNPIDPVLAVPTLKAILAWRHFHP